MSPAQILVVDDEPELQRLIKQRFRKQIQAGEYDFSFAGNGSEALQKLHLHGPFDLVLTDINMPEMDGLTFLHHLNTQQNSPNDTPIKALVLSAYNDMVHIRRAMNEGAYDFVTKPINFIDLEQTITKTLVTVRELKTQQAIARQQRQELQQAAFHDALTGLPNRTWLNQYLPKLLLQQQDGLSQSVAMLFIDLDRFKQINDNFGHVVGDTLLKCVAQRLKTCLHQGDAAVRLSGDEFIVLLHEVTHVEIAVAVAERIQQQFSQPFQIQAQSINVSASIGIALCQKEYQDPEQFVQAADSAMYMAKTRGRGRYVFFIPPVHSLPLELQHRVNCAD